MMMMLELMLVYLIASSVTNRTRSLCVLALDRRPREPRRGDRRHQAGSVGCLCVEYFRN